MLPAIFPMRKLTFIREPIDNNLKIILHEDREGIYLYLYDCIQDTSSVSDNFFTTLDEAEEFCTDTYKIGKDDWILLADTIDGCQDDFILPTRVKGREIGNPLWGQYEILEKGKWVDKYPDDKEINFGGMTVIERLFTSGLIQEFDKAKKADKIKAKQILAALQVDKPSIDKIV